MAALFAAAAPVFAQAPLPVGATLSVSGSFVPGSVVTYTATVKSEPGFSQADNTGPEFQLMLPAGVAFLDASASGGTTSHTTTPEAINWNSAIASDTTYTITIRGTLSAAATAYASISAQGRLMFDGNNDGSNESTLSTDDPSTQPPGDATAFKVAGLPPTVAQSYTGNLAPGETLTFTVTIQNPNAVAMADVMGDEFAELIPPACTLLSAMASSGTAVKNDPGDEDGGSVTWNGDVPANGTVTITFDVMLNLSSAGQTFSLAGSATVDTNDDGTSDTTVRTQDAQYGDSTGATVISLPYAILSAAQRVQGTLLPGTVVKLIIDITNNGSGTQPDIAAENEFSEVLPSGLTLLDASANSGNASADLGLNTVTFNGAIAAGATVTVTIRALIPANTAVDTQFSAQGTVTYDFDLSGDLFQTVLTSAPTSGEDPEPNIFTVRSVTSATDTTYVAGTRAATFNVLKSDFTGGLTLSVTGTSTSANATITVNPDGSITYTANGPLPGGTDSFTYTVSDGNGGSYTATVNVFDFINTTGYFNGLVGSQPDTTASNPATGLLRLTSTADGGFSGMLMLANEKFSFRGTFNGLGEAQFGSGSAATPDLAIKRKAKRGKPAPPELRLAFQLSQLTAVKGMLTQEGDPFAYITAELGRYTAKANPVAPLMNVPPELLGKYVVVFPPHATPNRGLGPLEFPRGYGFGFITVAKSGAATLAGTLADGTKVSAGNALSAQNKCALFSLLYAGGGSLSGSAQFTTSAVNGSAVSGQDFVWIRPAMPKSAKYKAGWPGGILVDFVGAPY